MAESIFSRPKEMVFAWCKDGQHDRCRKQYGVGRIICVCDCDPETHGKNYVAINKTMSEEEINTSLASINMIMTGDAGDGVSENRAVMSTSPIWGDQVKEGNKSGGSVAGYNTNTVSKSKDVTRYDYKETVVLDAKSVEELEQRRRGGTLLSSYDYSGFEAWI